MIFNYLKIAFRNLNRNKVYSFINIFGLSIGLACCILIILFVKNEVSYDSFHNNSDNIFRLSLFENYAKDEQHFNSITPARFGPELKSYYPEVENYVRVSKFPGIVKIGSKTFAEDCSFADTNFFQLFNFPLSTGRPAEVLKSLNSVVITDSYAEKFFGDSNPIGKRITIKIDNKSEDFIVSGIAKNVPANSSIQFNIVIPFQYLDNIVNKRAMNSLTVIICETYVFCQHGTTAKQMDEKMSSLVKSMEGSDYNEGTYNILFQPIKDIHLDTSFPVGLEPISNPIYSYALSIIGIFILIIAIINFVTLSIGKSVSRSAEVGIRKVVGATRRQLIGQYWGESLMLVFLSAVMGILFAEIFLPFFNSLAGKNLDFRYDPLTLLILLSVIVLTGLSAGIYPSLVLSSFNPVQVLMGKFKLGNKSILRRILVGGQFTLSVILITGTIIVFNQLEFVKNKNLGYNKENVVVIPTNLNVDETLNIANLFKNELSKNQNVIDVSAASTPLGEKWSTIGFEMPGGSYGRFYMNTVDYNYLKTTGIKLLKGRDFSKEFSTDKDQAVIVNEAFAKEFKINDLTTAKMPGRFDKNKIIGIVKDFNFESLHSQIKPALITLNYHTIFRAANDIDPNFEPRIMVKIKSINTKATLDDIRNTWKKLVPNLQYESSFLNDNIDKQYKSEQQLTTIISYSSVLSILITCLGLFGLTILITLQKTKEIGIRRLLGASSGSIYKLLSKEFFWLIISAQVIGMPIAWYILNKWLNGFAYRTSISVSMFLLAGILTIFIAFLTISFQAIKASFENPINSLRNE
ncbi:MAG TPA: ABC transporter permease [Ignavibacteriaceae bacterium]|nr:ABC transporter permease [Ignavibacteriaceae bacterium]